MTAQDVLAVCLQCRLVAHEPRRAPLLSPPVGKPTSMPTLMSKPGSVGTTAARGVFAVGAFGVVVAGLPGLPVDLVDGRRDHRVPLPSSRLHVHLLSELRQYPRKRSAEIPRGLKMMVRFPQYSHIIHIIPY